MRKLFGSTLIISLIASIPAVALADAYDRFMKTQMVEFQAANEDKCKKKTIETMQGEFKMTYELCIYRERPIYLVTKSDDVTIDVSYYRNGRLVRMILSEFGDGVGFRNGQPVVEWHYGESGKRGVNWNITPTDKAKYLDGAANQRRILLKFGIR